MPDVPEIDKDRVKRLGREIVLNARKENKLKHLTKRSVRDEIEKRLLLPEGSLLSLKPFLSQVIEDATAEKLESVSEAGPSSKKSNKKEGELETVGTTSTSIPSSKKKATKISEEKVKNEENAINDPGSKPVEYKSESEMSLVIHEPLKNKRKTKTAGVHKPKRKNDAPKKSSENENFESEMSVVEDVPSKKRKRKSGSPKILDKDEETIKKLKSIVVACGVRKVWSKEFKEHPTPREQISCLKEILKDLGMTSRPSMAEAKKIRERRELMQDVEAAMEYDKLRGAKSGKKNKKPASPSATESESEGEAAQVKRPKVSAAKSIMAILDEESD